MPKRGHQPRGLLVTDPGQFLVTVSAASPVQGATVTIFAQFATSSGSPVAEAGKLVTWGKAGVGGSFNTATSSTNINGVASVTLTVGTTIGGTYTVTANGTNSVTGTSPTITVVADLIPASLVITPATAALPVGATQQLTVSALNAIGGTVSAVGAAWDTSNASAATVSASGLVTAVAAGTANITARLVGLTSNVSVATVAFDSVPASIAIVPTSATLSGGTVQLTAGVKNAAGQVIPLLQPSAWASSNPAVATVNTTGPVTWVAAGSATITASLAALTSNGCAITASSSIGGGGGGTQTIATVDLPSTTLTTTVAATPRSGRTVTCANAAALTAALADLQPGDWVKVTSAAVLSGNFVVALAGLNTNWIWIDCTGSKPAEGTRFNGATDAVTYTPPVLETPNTTEALKFVTGAAFIRVMGLEVRANSANTAVFSLVSIGSGAETSAADLPTDIILDRCYVHGHPTLECRRGVTINAKRNTVIESTVEQIHSTGFDSQAIWGWNGPGPFKIVNNDLEASTEVFGFGGADPALTGNIPSDVEFRRNYVHRPMAYKTAGWLVKNLIELKVGRRVLIEGNVLENSWAAAQTFAIILWSVNQGNTNPTAETSHITFRKNIIRNVAGVFNLTDGYRANPIFVPLHHVAINNNVMIGVDNPAVIGGDKLLLIQAGLADIYIEHNTGFIPTQSAVVYTTPTGQRLTNHKFRNNLTGGGTYPLFMSPGPKWADITGAGCEFSGNVVVGPDASYFATLFGFPATGNSYPTSESALGLSGGASKTYDVTASPSDLALAVSSAYHLAGTDGTDPGADITAVLAAVSGVGGGF